MLHISALSWIMYPVYIWQGIRVRLRIERLLPTRLPVSGTIGGKGPPVKLLVIGDSTVASVGIEKLEGMFGFAIANAMHERSGRTVHWRSAGANSAASGDLRDHVLPHIKDDDFTHILVSVGTNDMKNFHLLARFKREFGTLLYALKARFPHAQIVWTPIPDMRKFPALPKGLARVLAARADLINAKGQQLCNERGVAIADPFPIMSDDGFARDGFHPNDTGYNAWARFLAPYLLAQDVLAPDHREGQTRTITPIATKSARNADSTN